MYRIKHVRLLDQPVIEKFNSKNGRYYFEGVHDQVEPDYLSGTTNKTRYYRDEGYYNILFTEFEANLKRSNLLLVIGYGFKDPGINQYLEKFFLSAGKKMVVIDPYLLKDSVPIRGEIEIIPKGIDTMRLSDFQQAI